MTIIDDYTLDTVEYCRVYDAMEKKAKQTLDYFFEKNTISSDKGAEVVASVIGDLLKNSLESVMYSTKLELDTKINNTNITKLKTETALLPRTLQSENMQEALKALNGTIGDFALGGLVIPTEMTTKSFSLIESLSQTVITEVEVSDDTTEVTTTE